MSKELEEKIEILEATIGTIVKYILLTEDLIIPNHSEVFSDNEQRRRKDCNLILFALAEQFDIALKKKVYQMDHYGQARNRVIDRYYSTEAIEEWEQMKKEKKIIFDFIEQMQKKSILDTEDKDL